MSVVMDENAVVNRPSRRWRYAGGDVAERLYERMVREAEGYLQAYGDDLHVHDKGQLQAGGWSRYVWILKHSGTWLCTGRYGAEMYIEVCEGISARYFTIVVDQLADGGFEFSEVGIEEARRFARTLPDLSWLRLTCGDRERQWFGQHFGPCHHSVGHVTISCEARSRVIEGHIRYELIGHDDGQWLVEGVGWESWWLTWEHIASFDIAQRRIEVTKEAPLPERNWHAETVFRVQNRR